MNLDALLTRLRDLLSVPPRRGDRQDPILTALAAWDEAELPEVAVDYLVQHAEEDRAQRSWWAGLGYGGQGSEVDGERLRRAPGVERAIFEFVTWYEAERARVERDARRDILAAWEGMDAGALRVSVYDAFGELYEDETYNLRGLMLRGGTTEVAAFWSVYYSGGSPGYRDESDFELGGRLLDVHEDRFIVVSCGEGRVERPGELIDVARVVERTREAVQQALYDAGTE